MKTPDATFITEKNKLTNRPVWLFTIYDYDSLGLGHNLNYAGWDADVVFAGVTYTRFPIKIDYTANNTTGQIDSVTITLGNVSRLVQASLEAYEFRGKKVKCQMVFIDQLADASAVIQDTYYIDTYTAYANNVVFTLSSKFDVLNLQCPSRIYMRTFCYWKFKSTECGYAGATTSCNKTASACKAMLGGSNFARFGGFPSVPQDSIYIA